MKANAFVLTLLTVFLIACSDAVVTRPNRDEAIKEIRKAEEDFAALCAKDGVQKAFAAYADDSAHIRSADSLISGKKAIGQYYAQPFFTTVSLQWSPDFIDASNYGDMGYTFGHYTFIVTDTKGKKSVSTGIFHTVWKKKDGRWKFVWDS